MTICTAQGEHTCLKDAGHKDGHLCPICMATWLDPGPLLYISPAVAERVERLLGRGLINADRFVVTRQGNKNDAAAGVTHDADRA